MKLKKNENKNIISKRVITSGRNIEFRVKLKYVYNFLISLPKHMLWVLKITVLMRHIFRAPNTYVKNDR